MPKDNRPRRIRPARDPKAKVLNHKRVLVGPVQYAIDSCEPTKTRLAHALKTETNVEKCMGHHFARVALMCKTAAALGTDVDRELAAFHAQDLCIAYDEKYKAQFDVGLPDGVRAFAEQYKSSDDKKTAVVVEGKE